MDFFYHADPEILLASGDENKGDPKYDHDIDLDNYSIAEYLNYFIPAQDRTKTSKQDFSSLK